MTITSKSERTLCLAIKQNIGKYSCYRQILLYLGIDHKQKQSGPESEVFLVVSTFRTIVIYSYKRTDLILSYITCVRIQFCSHIMIYELRQTNNMVLIIVSIATAL